MNRVCSKCKTWVYYENGDVTYHCGCHAGWIFEEESTEKENNL